jgi:hypothetical protein
MSDRISCNVCVSKPVCRMYDRVSGVVWNFIAKRHQALVIGSKANRDEQEIMHHLGCLCDHFHEDFQRKGGT